MQGRQVQVLSKCVFRQGQNAALSTTEVACIIKLPLGSRLLTLEVGAISGVRCWPLLLAGWVLSGCSQVSFGERKSMLLSPCITSIPATMATLFMRPLHTQDWLREVVDWNPQNRSSYPLDYENPPLLRLLLGEHSYGTRYPHAFCSFRKVSPRLLCPQFSNHAPSKSLTV